MNMTYEQLQQDDVYVGMRSLCKAALIKSGITLVHQMNSFIRECVARGEIGFSFHLYFWISELVSVRYPYNIREICFHLQKLGLKESFDFHHYVDEVKTWLHQATGRPMVEFEDYALTESFKTYGPLRFGQVLTLGQSMEPLPDWGLKSDHSSSMFSCKNSEELGRLDPRFSAR